MSPGAVSEVEAPRDQNGARITLHCRVFVPPRPSTVVVGYLTPAFGGIVEKIDTDEFWGTHIITVREFRNWNVRSVLPTDCKVQHGKTKASAEDGAARAAVGNGGRKPARKPRRK